MDKVEGSQDRGDEEEAEGEPKTLEEQGELGGD
jgi:hypothetical protein